MGDKYGVTGEENLSTSLQAVLQITNDATLRGRIYDMMFSAEGSMADEIAVWDVSRFSVAPTDTLVTPQPLDEDGPAALHSDCGEDGAATGTFTAGTEMFEQGIHLRAAFRWVAIPGGELILSAAASNGIGVRAKAPAASVLVHSTIHFEE